MHRHHTHGNLASRGLTSLDGHDCGLRSVRPGVHALRPRPRRPSRSNLRPSALPEEAGVFNEQWVEAVRDSVLRVEAAGEIDVRDGILGAGDGYLAAIGQPEVTAQVADATVSGAPVNLTVPDSPTAGARWSSWRSVSRPTSRSGGPTSRT